MHEFTENINGFCSIQDYIIYFIMIVYYCDCLLSPFVRKKEGFLISGQSVLCLQKWCHNSAVAKLLSYFKQAHSLGGHKFCCFFFLSGCSFFSSCTNQLPHTENRVILNSSTVLGSAVFRHLTTVPQFYFNMYLPLFAHYFFMQQEKNEQNYTTFAEGEKLRENTLKQNKKKCKLAVLFRAVCNSDMFYAKRNQE